MENQPLSSKPPFSRGAELRCNNLAEKKTRGTNSPARLWGWLWMTAIEQHEPLCVCSATKYDKSQQVSEPRNLGVSQNRGTPQLGGFPFGLPSNLRRVLSKQRQTCSSSEDFQNWETTIRGDTGKAGVKDTCLNITRENMDICLLPFLLRCPVPIGKKGHPFLIG